MNAIQLGEKKWNIPGACKNLFVGKTGTQWTVACFNPHHNKWEAGDAAAYTALGAIDYATSDTLVKFPSAIMALRCLAMDDDEDEAILYTKEECLEIFKKLNMEVEVGSRSGK